MYQQWILKQNTLFPYLFPNKQHVVHVAVVWGLSSVLWCCPVSVQQHHMYHTCIPVKPIIGSSLLFPTGQLTPIVEKVA